MSRNPDRAQALRRQIAWYRARDRSLRHGLDLSTAEEVARRGAEVGCEIHYYEGAERLMPLARAAILEADCQGRDIASGSVWWAGSLNQAKGRGMRTWWAPTGGIYLCLALAPFLLPRHWSLYNLGMGVAVAEVLRERGVPARLRWVNDVLIDGRKVVGMLSEGLTAPDSGQAYLLFGLGINVNIKSFPTDVPEAVSLCQVTGSEWLLLPLAAHVLARIGWVVGLLHHWEACLLDMEEEALLPNPVIQAWEALSNTLGRRVQYGADAELAPEFTALAVGIDRQGGLRLRLDDGTIFSVNTGEVRYVV